MEDETITEPLVRAEFNNCIIYGSEQREIVLVKDDSEQFNYKFNHCLIRFEDPNDEFLNDPLYQFEDGIFYVEVVRNQDPEFFDTELNNFNIETGTSGADGIGEPGIGPPLDIDQKPRGSQPDAGAYESIVFPDPPGGTP